MRSLSKIELKVGKKCAHSIWYVEKIPQRNRQIGEVFGHLKPLTELATGLIPRSNFANVPAWRGITRPALTGRRLPELILDISATARSSGGLGEVLLKFGALDVNGSTLRPPATRASLQEALEPVGEDKTIVE